MRLRTITFGMILVLAACGGGEDDLSAADEVTTTAGASAEPDDPGDDGQDPAPGDNGEDSAPGDSGSSSEIDVNDLPQPGEARLEVDGQTFVFTDDGASGEECTVTETDFFFRGSTEEGAEQFVLRFTGRLVGDTWAISITVDEPGDLLIHSQGNAVETPTIDGSTMSVEADFVRFSESGDSDEEDLGRGRLVGNCG